jgi:hypothetical protein
MLKVERNGRAAFLEECGGMTGGASNPPLPAAGSADKRQFPRFKVEGTTTSIGKPGLLASLGLGPIKFPVVNLSQGGAMVRVSKRLPMDSRHELRIEIPRYKEVIETVGEIRWCGESAKKETDIYIGLRFVDLSAAEQRKLAGIYELFTSAEVKAKSPTRKDASSTSLKPPNP